MRFEKLNMLKLLSLFIHNIYITKSKKIISKYENIIFSLIFRYNI